ncbi:hypothetical protein F4780DRAFT_738911 [Xylariomycetidae sp. FL0641]|nr:hypothetical protein F4780DRAFT_738911 [Xylariomycetidae sp. FL0641]
MALLYSLRIVGVINLFVSLRGQSPDQKNAKQSLRVWDSTLQLHRQYQDIETHLYWVLDPWLQPSSGGGYD